MFGSSCAGLEIRLQKKEKGAGWLVEPGGGGSWEKKRWKEEGRKGGREEKETCSCFSGEREGGFEKV